MVQREIYGVPIPLNYITPNLQFYPLVMPSNIIYVNRNNNNNNSFNNANININLSKEDHLHFIDKLMKLLNRNYIIIGNFFIDLTRKDYRLFIDNEKNTVSINNYQHKSTLIYITEKYFNKNIELLKVKQLSYHYSNNNNNNNNKFMNYHCNRIVSNTSKIQNRFNVLTENFMNKNLSIVDIIYNNNNKNNNNNNNNKLLLNK